MAEPHLDETALATLKRLMGDGFGVLIETYVSDSLGRLAVLRAALDVGDADGLRRAAHSFKGSSGNMAALRLAALCHQLELLAREDQLAGASALLEAIECEFVLVREQLDHQRPPAA